MLIGFTVVAQANGIVVPKAEIIGCKDNLSDNKPMGIA
jgi:hypothetical protein